MSTPVLSFPNTEDLFILDTDASDSCLGAELVQVQEGQERVIAYSSYVMTSHQRRYCTTRKELLAVIADEQDDRIPSPARTCLAGLARQLLSLEREIIAGEKRIHAWHRASEVSRRLETTPGIGPITASALAASITDPHVFRSGRGMAAWIGLVPKQTSTGGKDRLGRISKQGDQYLRWLLVAGAMTVVRHAKRRGTADTWLADIIANKPTKVAAVALANKNARIAWALLRYGGTYRRPATAAA